MAPNQRTAPTTLVASVAAAMTLAACVSAVPTGTVPDATTETALPSDASADSALDINSDESVADTQPPDVVDSGCDALVCTESQDCVEAAGVGSCVEKCTAPEVWNPATQTCISMVDCSPCALASRACDNSTGSAECGACLEGFFDDGGNCEPVGSCAVGAADSIATTCDDLNRNCIPPSTTEPAACGDCDDGFTETPGQAFCTFAQVCDGDVVCNGTNQCLQLSSGPEGVCSPPLCSQGEAWDRLNDVCKTCGACGEGTVGLVWPVTDHNGNCVCQTQPGYFWDPAVAATQAVACDKDGDGWTNEKVAQLLAQVSQAGGAFFDDLALIANARCDINAIDGVVLVNEFGQTKTLSLADLGSNATSVPLFESSRNDRGDATDPMPSLGRPFLPEEANSLTKACADQVDLNDNGVSDAQEGQDYSGGGAFQQFFNAIGYFTELYDGTLVDGKWHIVERSRCELGFPLTYASNDDYWTSCHRRRSDSYTGNGSQLTYDFARFDCDVATGGCPLDPPIPAPQDGIEVPPHGVCDGLAFSPNAPWRGMTHYSQFTCALVLNTPGGLASSEVSLGAIKEGGTHAATTCVLGEATGTMACEVVDDDSAADAAVDTVLWAGRRFTPYEVKSNYDGGCIDEGAEWPQLCPGFGDALLQANGDEDGFGALSCGCPAGYIYEVSGCLEIDECADPALNNCDPLATCTNDVGGFSCVCPDGYVGDGTSCVDIDECVDGIDNCHEGFVDATCTNIPGGFTCTCPDLFAGDGLTCEGGPLEGLYAHYPLDEPTPSVVVDASGNGNDASIEQAYASQFNPGFGLELVADRFDSPEGAWQVLGNYRHAAKISFPTTFTVAFWHRPGGPHVPDTFWGETFLVMSGPPPP